MVKEAGVKIIHGTSTHHVQPPEFIGESLVLYGMGDFVDDYAVDPVFRNDKGIIASVEIDTRGQITHVEFVPTLILEEQVNLIEM